MVEHNSNLYQCPDCAEQVSKRAQSCPKCGAPLLQPTTTPISISFSRIRVFSLFGTIAVIVALAGYFALSASSMREDAASLKAEVERILRNMREKIYEEEKDRAVSKAKSKAKQAAYLVIDADFYSGLSTIVLIGGVVGAILGILGGFRGIIVGMILCAIVGPTCILSFRHFRVTNDRDIKQVPKESANETDIKEVPKESANDTDIKQVPKERANNTDIKQVPQEIANGIGMKLVLIPAGTFTMGEVRWRESDTPHEVTISKSYYLDVCEVTQIDYERVMGSNPSKFNGAKNPVETVNWEDAVSFCKKLSARPEEKAAGREYRLPTEAEWEYACRAGSTTSYGFGETAELLGEYAWYNQNAGNKTHPVGEKKPNRWGLHDMHGNVWEWCQDVYEPYPSGAVTDPQGPNSGSDRVFRGGSWIGDAGRSRSAHRGGSNPSGRDFSNGFRVALSPSAKQPEEIDKSSDEKEVPESITNSIGMKLVLIHPGSFTMGSPKEKLADETPHEVTISKSYHLGAYEVTQDQYEKVMGANPSQFKGAKNPVEMVSWDNAVSFCKKLSELPDEKAAGREYRLPTEAEWEYACRAGSTTSYGFGDTAESLGEYAWFKENAGNETHPVGEKKPNRWGLYDMHGDVWEWCQDVYEPYPSGAVTDPQGPNSGSYRVIRGGGWNLGAAVCRSAFRITFVPADRANYLGFRVALIPTAKQPEEIAKSSDEKEVPKKIAKSTDRKLDPQEIANSTDIKQVPKEITNGIGMKLVLIPAGTFTMGSPMGIYETQHEVTISKSYYLGVYEVTQG